jgi:hypothetical protein
MFVLSILELPLFKKVFGYAIRESQGILRIHPHSSVDKGDAELVSYRAAVTYNFNLASHQKSERVHDVVNKPIIRTE